MRRFLITLAVISVSLLTSCSKDYPAPEPAGDKYLVDVLDLSYYETSSQFSNYIASVLSGDLNPVASSILFEIFYKGEFESLIEEMYAAQDEPTQPCRLEKYVFTYKSVDVIGNPVTLSGTVIFPNIVSDVDTFTLDGISLYNSNWTNTKNSISQAGSPVFLRTLFNQVVVIPDYQGFGATSGTYFPSLLCYNELARQAVDCEMAALELVKKFGGNMKEGYETYVMGVGRGAAVSMATQKYLETFAPEDVRTAINLSSTYCCAGSYDNKELLNHYRENGGNAEFTVSAIQNIYYANPDIFFEYKLSDFFSDEYNSGVSDLSEVSQIMNPRFFRASGSFNFDEPLSKLFFKALERETTIIGWAPKSHIFVEHSKLDDEVPYRLSRNSFTTLSYNGGALNHKVDEHIYNHLSHDSMMILGMIRILAQKDPSIDEYLKYQLINDEENN